MCGIITIYNQDNPVNTDNVLDLYLDQKKRGIDGFGFSYLDSKGVVMTKRFEHESQVFYALSGIKSNLIQFHHRHPTSTDNIAIQNHPICNYNDYKNAYSFVHNGIVQGTDKLKAKHNVKYSTNHKGTYNDSETLMHETIRFIERNEKVTSNSVASIVMLQMHKKTHKLQNIYFARNSGNPLNLWLLNGDTVLSSEMHHNLKKEEVELPVGKLYSLDWHNSTTLGIDDFVMPVQSYTQNEYCAWSGYDDYDYDDIGDYSKTMGFDVNEPYVNQSDCFHDANMLLDMIPKNCSDDFERNEYIDEIDNLEKRVCVYNTRKAKKILKRLENKRIDLLPSK